MNKEKQIESIDWLTRGIPKEQLEREKREAIMAADLQGCITYDEWSAREYGIESVDFDTTAEKMVAKGYRKQSEGEWREDVIAFCNVCSSCRAKVDRSAIKCNSGKLHYCPNCGAKMKGGGEQ